MLTDTDRRDVGNGLVSNRDRARILLELGCTVDFGEELLDTGLVLLHDVACPGDVDLLRKGKGDEVVADGDGRGRDAQCECEKSSKSSFGEHCEAKTKCRAEERRADCERPEEDHEDLEMSGGPIYT